MPNVAAQPSTRAGSGTLGAITPFRQTPAPRTDDPFLQRVTTVRQLLQQAAISGSDRDVVVAFVEALAVCEDIEVRGYSQGFHGDFQRTVTLPGSAPEVAPEHIEDDAIPGDAILTRLSNSDAERLGFVGEQDVWVARFDRTGDIPWLLALSGVVGPSEEARIGLYVDLVGQALRTVVTVSTARINWSILEQLLVKGEQVEAAGMGALTALGASVDAVGALVVTMNTGMHVLSIGDAEGFSTPRAQGSADQIVTTARVLDRYTAVLAVRRSNDKAFNRRERQIVEGAIAIFAAWLVGVVQRPGYGEERRQTQQRFDRVIERIADGTVRDGAAVSLVLVKTHQTATPAVLHEWVSDLRRQLRATDLAGLVAEDEVAILLTDTGSPEVDRVVRRLRQSLSVEQRYADLRPSAIGVTTRRPGSPSSEPLLPAARERAAAARGI